MTDETKMTVAEMIRSTADNNAIFMKSVAAHVASLETTIESLTAQINELTGKS